MAVVTPPPAVASEPAASASASASATAAAASSVLTLTPSQDALVALALGGPARQLLYGGAIRGGKTVGALLLVTLLARAYPRSRWAIVRRTLPDLRRTVLPSWRALHPGTGFFGAVNRSTWTATARNGSEVLFFPESLDTDPDLNRWRGLEVSGFVLEEANELSERSYWKAVERAGTLLLPGAQPPPVVVATCNPSPGWVKRLFHDPWHAGTLPPSRAFLPALPADNPHIPEAVRQSWRALPERDYRRFVLGEWTDLTGSALDELDEAHHLIAPFAIPAHWPVWAAFDWGFTHPAVWMWFVADEAGTAYLVDTYRARRLRDDQLAEGIIEAAPAGFVGRLTAAEAGADCWSRYEARTTDRTRSTAEVFADHGLGLRRANAARMQGLNNLRQWLAWRPASPDAAERVPRLRIIRTPANLRVFDRLREVLLDPDRPGDARKADADPETGEGGDDEYDCLRYGLAGRPVPAPLAPLAPALGAWSPEVLAWEADRTRRGLPLEPAPTHPVLTRNPARPW